MSHTVGGRTCNEPIHRFNELNERSEHIENAGIKSVVGIGDCRAPGTIAHAVYAGHECARTIDAGDEEPVIRVERPSLSLNI